MDLFKLMKMATDAKAHFAKLQEEAQAFVATGEAGGGLVRIALNGRYEATSVHIDAKAINLQNLKLLEDLVQAAINQATSQIMDKFKSNLGDMASNFGLDLKTLGIGD